MDFMHSGHRGAMALAPENTIGSFRTGERHGANELELDLRLSRDGVMVVIHDATVDRTTNGTGAVAELPYARIRELDAGGGDHIPTFEEVLAATTLPLQVEIKDVAVLEPFFDLVEHRPGLLPRLSPSSFDAGVAAALVERLPATVTVGLISEHASPVLVDRAAAIGVRRVLLGWSGADPGLVGRARERGLHYGIWPVNTAEQFRRAVALDVDGFTTDDPRIVARNGYELRAGRLARRHG